MWLAIKIRWYKRKARAAYLGYMSVVSEYDCSSILTRAYSRSAIMYANRFNTAMRKLRKLDPKAPDMKL